ncbi:primosomal protein N' [Thermaurantiacus sp.]
MAGRVPVLLLDHRLGFLDYAVPEGLACAPGDVVEVPLGPRRVMGIAWDGPGDRALPEARLRPILRRLDLPPVGAALRQTIAWVADYYVASPGHVARMALPAAALGAPPREPRRFRVAEPLPSLRPAARRALADALLAHGGSRTLAQWRELTGASLARLGGLVAAGALVVADRADGTPVARRTVPTLSLPQQAAAAALLAAVREGGFHPFLLDGVTGSGKTEVYLEAIGAVIDRGGQALVLLPEIALTAPFLRRFEARFGFRPAVWHSSVTPAARRRAFAAIAGGAAPVVVGARSALFLPLPRLALIVVDEAHEAAFKQEEGVFYHGRDVAVVRARAEGVPVVLATATPGLETLENVARGRYRRLELPDRFGGARLPCVHLVDLVKTPPARGDWIAPPLAQAIEGALANGEQVLLFLNRRGYAPLTLCRACGARIACPNCTAWLVDHRLEQRLLCHHCGYAVPRPAACPACGAGESLVASGPGVERLAEEVARRWPGARVAIVTSDTVRTQAEAEALVGRVLAREVDLLIGTQLLAKGHDFPELTVVGVVDADLGLAGGDLRAGERTFQQVAQVAGRAGRARKPGTVFLQTHQPGAPIMQALARHDREAFLAAERAARAAAGMPPYGRLAALIVSAERAETAEAAARALAAQAPRADGLQVFGPVPAPLAVLRGRHRLRFLVRAPRGCRLQAHLRAWLGAVKLPSAARVVVDVDPQSFL